MTRRKPQGIVSEAFKAHEVGDSPEGCRPLRGLDGFPNITWGFAFGFTPGFTPPPASRA
jgi:hypothetical protein